MQFIHRPPHCHMLVESTMGAEQGAYFTATCTACPDRGSTCDADGCECPYHLDPQDPRYRLKYDQTRAELECLVLAMNGGAKLFEWKAARAKRHDPNG